MSPGIPSAHLEQNEAEVPRAGSHGTTKAGIALTIAVTALTQASPAECKAEQVTRFHQTNYHCATISSTFYTSAKRNPILISLLTRSDVPQTGLERTRSSKFPADKERLLELFAIPEPTMDAQASRLLAPRVAEESVQERTDFAGPFTDFQDYVHRGLKNVPTRVKAFKVKGHSTEIALSESYAAKLDAHQGSIAIQPSRSTTAGSKQAARPKRKLIAAEDLPALLDQMPNSTYFKRIWISDNRNPEDDWVTQTYFPKTEQNPDGFISDMSMIDGQMSTYKAEKNDYFRRNGLHEWSHQLRYHFWDSPLRTSFDNAVNLEMFEWSPSIYSGRSNGEQWAVLGERLLSTDAGQFLEATEKAPVRCALWMKALSASLDEVPAESRSVNHERYRRRADYVKQMVLPSAVAKLKEIIAAEPTEFLRVQAKDVYRYLNQSEVSAVSNG